MLNRIELFCNFIKKENLAQVFSYEFWDISKNIFFREHLRTTASVFLHLVYNSWSVSFWSVSHIFL